MAESLAEELVRERLAYNFPGDYASAKAAYKILSEDDDTIMQTEGLFRINVVDGDGNIYEYYKLGALSLFLVPNWIGSRQTVSTRRSYIVRALRAGDENLIRAQHNWAIRKARPAAGLCDHSRIKPSTPKAGATPAAGRHTRNNAAKKSTFPAGDVGQEVTNYPDQHLLVKRTFGLCGVPGCWKASFHNQRSEGFDKHESVTMQTAIDEVRTGTRTWVRAHPRQHQAHGLTARP